VSSALETLGKPAIGLTTIIMSASLGNFVAKFYSKWTLPKGTEGDIAMGAESDAAAVLPHGQSDTAAVLPAIASPRSDPQGPNTVAPCLTVLFVESCHGGGRGCEPRLNEVLPYEPNWDAESKPSSQRTTQPSQVPNGKGIASPDNSKGLAYRGSELMSVHVLLALAIGKTVLAPILNVLAVVLLADTVIPESPDRPLIKLVLMLQAAVPSSDTTIVLAQQHGRVAVAETLAAAYLLQYGLSVVSMSTCIGIAVNTFF